MRKKDLEIDWLIDFILYDCGAAPHITYVIQGVQTIVKENIHNNSKKYNKLKRNVSQIGTSQIDGN